MGVIAQVERWQKLFLKKTGSRKVYLSDEWYLMSDSELPPYSHYEDFPQIENGVGMASSFLQEFDDALARRRKKPGDRTISLVTGVLAGSIVTEAVRRAEKRFPSLRVLVYPIENQFFGNTVTVTGLLTGTDICGQLKGKPLGDMLLLPSNMFRAGTEILLDDLSLNEISKVLGANTKKVDISGAAFLKAILDG